MTMMRSGLLLSWLAMGCAGEEEAPAEDSDVGTEVVDSDEPEPEPEPAAPTIEASFTNPVVAAGESAELVVTIENFTVVDPTASPTPKPKDGEGHFHLFLDGALFVAAWTPTVTIATDPEDAPGDYVFRVALVDSGHFEVEPAVSTEVTLTIE